MLGKYLVDCLKLQDRFPKLATYILVKAQVDRAALIIHFIYFYLVVIIFIFINIYMFIYKYNILYKNVSNYTKYWLNSLILFSMI